MENTQCNQSQKKQNKKQTPPTYLKHIEVSVLKAL